MSHVYEGKPDARQGDDTVVTSRFRPKYRALSDEEKSLHDEIKAKAVELEQAFEKVRPADIVRWVLLRLKKPSCGR